MEKPPKTAIEHCDCSLVPVDEELLAILADEGARTTRYLNDSVEADVGKSWVCERLGELAEHGPVERVDQGLYELQSEALPDNHS